MDEKKEIVESETPLRISECMTLPNLPKNLRDFASNGDVNGLRAWLDEKPRRVSRGKWIHMTCYARKSQEMVEFCARQAMENGTKVVGGFNDAHLAAMTNDVEALRAAAERGADLRGKTTAQGRFQGQTPLEIAAGLGCSAVAHALVEDRAFTADDRAIGMAIRGGHVELARTLLALDAPRRGALSAAVDKESVELATLLLEDAPPDVPAYYVHSAAMVDLLASRGWKPELRKAKLFGDDTLNCWERWSARPVAFYDALVNAGATPSIDDLFALMGNHEDTDIDAADAPYEQSQRKYTRLYRDALDWFIGRLGALDQPVEVSKYSDVADFIGAGQHSLTDASLPMQSLSVVKRLVAAGAPAPTLDPDPEWVEGEEKRAWLESLGAERVSFTPDAFVRHCASGYYLDDAVAAIFGSDGVLGVRPGMSEAELRAAGFSTGTHGAAHFRVDQGVLTGYRLELSAELVDPEEALLKAASAKFRKRGPALFEGPGYRVEIRREDHDFANHRRVFVEAKLGEMPKLFAPSDSRALLASVDGILRDDDDVLSYPVDHIDVDETDDGFLIRYSMRNVSENAVVSWPREVLTADGALYATFLSQLLEAGQKAIVDADYG